MPMIDETKLPMLARAEKSGCIGDEQAARVFFESLTPEEVSAVIEEIQTVLAPIVKALQPYIDLITMLQEKITCQ